MGDVAGGEIYRYSVGGRNSSGEHRKPGYPRKAGCIRRKLAPFGLVKICYLAPLYFTCKPLYWLSFKGG